jgi:hypothetical protein
MSTLNLPALVPPTSFKPVMSRQQLRTKVETDDFLQDTSLIVVIGCSVASSDEHFNDLLRQSNPCNRTLVVNPRPRGTLKNVRRVLGIQTESLGHSQWNGMERRAFGRLIYVAAKAEAVDNNLISEIAR